MKAKTIQSLRDRGLISTNEAGDEVLTISMQAKRSLAGKSYSQRKSELAQWEHSVRAAVERYEGRLLPGTLSVAAQTVEASVPVKVLENGGLEEELRDVEFRIVEIRDATQ